MSDRMPTSVVLPAVVALVLLGAYVGVYYETVWPIHEGRVAHASYSVPRFAATYPSVWMAFFRPIHWLDRRIRPNVWEPPQ